METEYFWDTDAVEEVYTCTVDQDQDLRDAVAKTIVSHSKLLDSERAQSRVKDLDLCFDLMMRFRKLKR